MGKPNKASNGHLRLGQPMPEDKEPRERTRGRRSGRVTCLPPKNDQWRKRQDQPGSNTWTRPRYTRWAPVNKTILAFNHNCEDILSLAVANMTVWPSGLRRWLQAPVRKGVGSNPTAVIVDAKPFASSSACGKYCVSGHTSYFPQSKEDANGRLVDGPQNAGLRPWVGNSKWEACRWAI